MSAVTEPCVNQPHLHSPAPLWRLAARSLLLEPSVVGVMHPVTDEWHFSRYIVLPEFATEQLLSECHQLVLEGSHRAASAATSCVQLLASSRRARVRCCDLRSLPTAIDASVLLRVLAGRPRSLRIDSPVRLQSAAQLGELQRVAARLRQLWLTHSCTAASGTCGDTLFTMADTSSGGGELRPVVLTCPRLLSLLIHGSPTDGLLTSGAQLSQLLLTGAPRLTHLEISNVYRELDTNFLLHLPQLRMLVLHNVCLSSLRPLQNCHQLHYLDLSVPGSRQLRSWPEPDQQLAQLVEALPLLQHLDIACTNLAGSGIHDGDASNSNNSGGEGGVGGSPPAAAVCDIVGLISRANRPLRYLNIYGCNAAHRQHIPAAEIGGELSDKQLLAAAAPHRHHPLMMIELLDQLEALLQMSQHVSAWREILHLALDTALQLGQLKDVHIRCAAVVQNVIVSRTVLASITLAERQRVLRQAFRSVRVHRRSVRLRHYVVLILMNFDIPRDMLFAFDDYLDTLGFMLHGVIAERDNFVERVLIYFLNKTCCDVDDTRKELIGARGLIRQLLKAIHARLSEHVCDEVMHYLWSCLWNVTDETPANCRLFLDHRGLTLFLGCLRQFSNNSVELVRNMMGLMGNIAEVSHLRAPMYHSDCVNIFCQLLEYEAPSAVDVSGGAGGDLEVGYHAGGVLAHLLSDGRDAWPSGSQSRDHAAARLHSAVRQWNVQAERTINYRSLRPIVRLLACRDEPECQLWASWALANLTHAVPDRYAPMVRDEGALPLLQSLVESKRGEEEASSVHAYLTHLASLCLLNVSRVLSQLDKQRELDDAVDTVNVNGMELDARADHQERDVGVDEMDVVAHQALGQ